MAGGGSASVDQLQVNGPVTIELNEQQVAAGIPYLRIRGRQSSGVYWEWRFVPNGAQQMVVQGAQIGEIPPPATLPQGALRFFTGLTIEGPFGQGGAFLAIPKQTLVDGANVVPVLSAGGIWILSAAGSRTIAAPSDVGVDTQAVQPRFVLFRLLNNTAGAIVTTFNAIYHVNWTDPAAGKTRTMLMLWDGAAFWQVGVVSADIT